MGAPEILVHRSVEKIYLDVTMVFAPIILILKDYKLKATATDLLYRLNRVYSWEFLERGIFPPKVFNHSHAS